MKDLNQAVRKMSNPDAINFQVLLSTSYAVYWKILEISIVKKANSSEIYIS